VNRARAGEWRRAMGRLAPIGALALGLLAFGHFAAGDIDAVDLTHRLAAPSADHPLGTDHLGRDLLARLAAGGSSAFLVVLTTLSVSLVGGIALAFLAATGPRPVGAAVRRACDLALAVPGLVVALIVTAAFGLTPLSAALALALGATAGVAHLALGLFAMAAASGPVAAAVALGGSPLHVWRRHVLPAAWPGLALAHSYEAARILLSWSALTFLGLGADSSRPDWGAMVFEYRLFLFDAPHLVLLPVAAIGVVALAFAFAGDPSDTLLTDAPSRDRA